jgi:hypothetical protein
VSPKGKSQQDSVSAEVPQYSEGMDITYKYVSGTSDWIDAVIRWRWRYLLLGPALWASIPILPMEYRAGIAILGFAIFTLGFYGLILRYWRTDPGLWMAALLVAVLLSPCVAYFEFLHIESILNPQGNPRPFKWTDVCFVLEILMSLHYFWKQVRLALSVAYLNHKLSPSLREAKRLQNSTRH